ncbi:TPA: hypothetical protein ACH3X3_000349 [Trebouxia sp. C0006]
MVGLRYTQHEGQPLLAPSTQERGKFFLFYSYSGISGGPLLAALVSGEAAEAIDKVPAGEAVAEAMTVLKGIFEPRAFQSPPPCSKRQDEQKHPQQDALNRINKGPGKGTNTTGTSVRIHGYSSMYCLNI